MKRFAYVAILLTSSAFAADVTVTWTPPTQNTDGSAIPATGAGSIDQTRVEYGTCSGPTSSVFGTKAGEVAVPAPATSVKITGFAPATRSCFRAYARNTYGVESVASLTVAKDIPAPTPNPPVLAVPVIAGMLQTPVYSVTAAGARSAFVGFTDVGTQCSGPVLFSYRAQSFREVPKAAVKLWASTTQRLAAPCA